ncbi:MAG TPA: lysophospholipid acyltransferase family protein, partial [Rhodanobacteraceae bacterium]|nr:lysophospholipid acyltransferase family protein [Rhodanobacteraceae bacterium]
MSYLLRLFFYGVLVRTVVLFVLGLNVRHRERLPTKGPAIIAANHNSHIDTLILLCLFPGRMLEKVRPVAAADHFLTSPLSTWFSTKLVGIIPVNRKGAGRGEDVLAECKHAL